MKCPMYFNLQSRFKSEQFSVPLKEFGANRSLRWNSATIISTLGKIDFIICWLQEESFYGKLGKSELRKLLSSLDLEYKLNHNLKKFKFWRNWQNKQKSNWQNYDVKGIWDGRYYSGETWQEPLESQVIKNGIFQLWEAVKNDIF